MWVEGLADIPLYEGVKQMSGDGEEEEEAAVAVEVAVGVVTVTRRRRRRWRKVVVFVRDWWRGVPWGSHAASVSYHDFLFIPPVRRRHCAGRRALPLP